MSNMKEISYNIALKDILALLAGAYQVDDGHWGLELIFESAPCNIPQLLSQQAIGIFPGVINRVIGTKLVQVPNPIESSTITIKDGRLLDALDSNNSRPIESDNSSGENSGYVRETPSSSPSRSRSLKRVRRSKR